MKLWNLLIVGTIATLAAVGCSSTGALTTGDGGATGDGAVTIDTGTKPTTDTGTTPTVDSGTLPPADTGTPGSKCAECQKGKCAAATEACGADPECGKRITCMNACIGKPGAVECQSKCINDIPSTSADDLIKCLRDNCKAECTA